MRKQILCVAYDSALAETRKLLLEHAGYAVTSALGSAAAKHAALFGQFDAILIGQDAPYAQRLDIVRWMKANRPEVCVVALHSSASENLPLVDYFGNAYDATEWLGTLRKALQ